MTTKSSIPGPNSMFKLIKMSKEELLFSGKSLHINYYFSSNKFGKIIVAKTSKGICFLSFFEEETEAIELVKKEFPAAQFTLQLPELAEDWLEICKSNTVVTNIPLHLKGTDFQIKVWQALLEIPFGRFTNYGHIAQKINAPKAARAVGTAIGANPIAFLIPCHRVIQASGKLGGFRWGLKRKAALIAWEASYQD